MSSLREQKAAALRVRLASELEKRLGNQRFDKVKVIDLGKAVGTSKVTFFKYFETKEELLRYLYYL